MTIKTCLCLNKVVSLEMEISPTTTTPTRVKKKFDLLEFEPFPNNSVNLIVGPTGVGKTFFVTRLLNNFKLYFASPVKRIFVVLCNDRVEPIVFDSDLPVVVEQKPLSEFIPDDLQESDLVLLDDLQLVTESVRFAITVCAHHYNLVSLFVVTHNLVGNANFELVKYCHRLFMFMSASANVNQLFFLINRFYYEDEVKKYLKSVANFCQKEKEILALELNPLAAQNKNRHVQTVLAFSHITTLITKGYFFIYPYPHWGKEYVQDFVYTVEKTMSLDVSEAVSFPVPTLVAVPLEVVREKKKHESKQQQQQQTSVCAEKNQWEQTVLDIEENIESYFAPPRWQRAKNVAKEILQHPQYCVSVDGKTFHLKSSNKPSDKMSLIDFVNVVTRRVGPKEKIVNNSTWKACKLHVSMLLKNNAPRDLFKNKLIL